MLSRLQSLNIRAEYLGVAERFKSGGYSFNSIRPSSNATLNFEFACQVSNRIEIAVKYKSLHDKIPLHPEKQYGAAVTYSLLKNTYLGLEYLYGDFDKSSGSDLISANFTIQF